MTHIYLFNEGARAAEYGIGTYIRQLTECLQSRQGISLTIVQLYSPDKDEFIIEEEKATRTIYCPGSGLPSPKLLEKYYRNVWYLIYPCIQYKEGDNLIFHLNYCLEYPLLEKMKQDFPLCRIIYTIHYQKWCFTLKGNTSWFKRIIHKQKEDIIDDEEKKVIESYEAEKKTYALVDQIVCLSEYTMRLLITEYQVSPAKIVKIYNGLNDEAVILAESDKVELKKKLGFAGTDKIILFVGRLEENKGADVLIRAFNQIVTEYSACRLVIAGDGDLVTQYMQDIKGCWGKVIFTGKLGKADLYKFYQVAELGVISSMHEQCSYVAMEMMMFGIPLITTAVRGLNEMIADGVNGWKVSVVERDRLIEIPVEALKERIAGFLSGSQKLDKSKIRKAYQDNYTIIQMKESYIQLYLMN